MSAATIEARGVGVHTDMTDAEYFAHPALSHSDCKLIDPPAFYRWVKDNKVRENKPEYDFGHVVHELVLGSGAGIDVIDADNWRTKAAQEARAESYANDRAPMLTHEYEAAKRCADAVSTHPVAAKLLDLADYREVALIWDDGDVQRKAKADLISGRFGVDLKTTQRASTEAFGRSAGKFGYATQEAWYLDAMTACLVIDDPEFLFIVVEVDPPNFVNVIQLDPYAVELAAERNRQRIELFRQCRDSGEWPAYGTGINQAQLPRWAEIEMEND